ncbi:hypothetical protein FVE85_8431 [Porphyridium purpureum]|uniref:Uncharacterized protein n=1 Tax=Porphyridium purpureum TaxID=35688 RepID=A0A5J4YKG3_PORPP|nr:hypothetical protein FVE85_8431 [Porphyridium purpureum]|eukprot:POR6271..scf244_11
MDKSPDLSALGRSLSSSRGFRDFSSQLPMSPSMERMSPYVRKADVIQVPPKTPEGIPRSPSLGVSSFPRVFSLPTPGAMPPHLELSPGLGSYPGAGGRNEEHGMLQPTLAESRKHSSNTVTERAAKAQIDYKDIWLMP